jgi:hypothetical protein
MKIYFYYFLLFVVLLILQFSFLNVLFPFVGAPLCIIAAGVIWTIRLGFRKALWLLVPLLLLYDVLGAGRIEVYSLYILFFSYAMSFLSRRVLLENTLVSTFFYSFLIFLGVEFAFFLSLYFTDKTFLVTALGERRYVANFLVAWFSFFLVKKIIFFFQNKIDQLRSDNALMIR